MKEVTDLEEREYNSSHGLMEVMLADRIKILKMEIGNMTDDVLLNNRALWLKNEELSYLQKSKIKRKYCHKWNIETAECFPTIRVPPIP